MHLPALHIDFALFSQTLLSLTFSTSCSDQNAMGMPQEYSTTLLLSTLRTYHPRVHTMKLMACSAF